MRYLSGCAIDGCGSGDGSIIVLIIIGIIAFTLLAFLFIKLFKKKK